MSKKFTHGLRFEAMARGRSGMPMQFYFLTLLFVDYLTGSCTEKKVNNLELLWGDGRINLADKLLSVSIRQRC